MNYALLAAAVIGIFLQSFFDKKYSVLKNSSIAPFFLYNAFTGAAGVIILTLAGILMGEFTVFHLPTVLYGIAFSVFYFAAIYSFTMEIKSGSLAMSSLFYSYALLIPSVVGIIFFGNDVTVTKVVGIVILLAALFLINDRAGATIITRKWVIWILIAFLGNGLCSVTQVVHQHFLPGEYRILFLETGFAAYLVFSIIGYLVTKNRMTKRLFPLLSETVYQKEPLT